MAKVIVAILVLLCAASVATAQLGALFQRSGDGSCSDFNLNTCTPCTDNCGNTKYYLCEGDGNHVDCYSSTRSDCSYESYAPDVVHRDCGQLQPCAIGYQQKFTVEWDVQASSALAAYSEPHGRDSYVQMSGSSASAAGHVGNVLYVSGSDEVRFETTFNQTTYLTSAGACDFGETCYAGSLAYSAALLPISNGTEPALAGTRVEIHTDGLVGFKNVDASTSTWFTALLGDEFNIGSDELSEVVIEASANGSPVILSNLVLARVDSPAPVLYFDVETESGFTEYDYVTCEWEGRTDSSEWWYAEPIWGYGDAVAKEPVKEERVAATGSTTPTPTRTTTRTPSSTPQQTHTPSASRSQQCSPFHMEPVYGSGSNDDDYVRCSLDRLFDSNEFFSYGSFGSFGLVQSGPLQRLMSAFKDMAGVFRL